MESRPNSYDLNSFSSKTAYRNSKLTELKDSLNYMSKCNLVQINSVFRHGTRFPSVKDMAKIEEVHKKIIKSKAHTVLPVAFQNWRLPFLKTKDKELASVGYQEMMILGNNFRERLHDLFNWKDVMKYIKVYTSSLSRSKLSAAAFFRSFLNETKSLKEVTKSIVENDQSLRFFDNCPYYTSSVLKNKASKMEHIRFKNGPEVKRIIKDIQQKWKLTDVDLTPDDVVSLYIMCGYEIATNLSSYMKPHICPESPAGDGLIVCPHQHNFKATETSPLCSLLESDQYAVLEYIYDLKHYWVKSYGKEINWLQACGLMSPIIQQIMEAARAHQTAMRSAAASNVPLQNHLDKQSFSRGVFWFGHAETLLPLVSLLGLFNQTSPVTSKTFSSRLVDMYDASKRFQTFRTANIVPFAGNLALELYHCPSLAKDGLSGYRIQVKVNEKAVAWPLANGHSHISLELFTKYLNLCLADKYDHNAICVLGLSASQLQAVHKRSDEL